MSVLDQIKAHLANPIQLRHVNPAEEEEKRKRHRQTQMRANTGLLKSLAARAEQKKEIRLLDSVRYLNFFAAPFKLTHMCLGSG